MAISVLRIAMLVADFAALWKSLFKVEALELFLDLDDVVCRASRGAHDVAPLHVKVLVVDPDLPLPLIEEPVLG